MLDTVKERASDGSGVRWARPSAAGPTRSPTTSPRPSPPRPASSSAPCRRCGRTTPRPGPARVGRHGRTRRVRRGRGRRRGRRDEDEDEGSERTPEVSGMCTGRRTAAGGSDRARHARVIARGADLPVLRTRRSKFTGEPALPARPVLFQDGEEDQHEREQADQVQRRAELRLRVGERQREPVHAHAARTRPRRSRTAGRASCARTAGKTGPRRSRPSPGRPGETG